MKKMLITFFIICLSLFLFINIPKYTAKNNEYIYTQDFHSIKFENLNSKNINELFSGISGTIVEVEVEIGTFTKSYRFNTSMLNDLERELTELVIEDLIIKGERELAVTHQIQGFKITRIDIRCTLEELEKIKNRDTRIKIKK